LIHNLTSNLQFAVESGADGNARYSSKLFYAKLESGRGSISRGFGQETSFLTQPYFDAGFPHGFDQWISAAGTNWATLALSQAAKDRSGSARWPQSNSIACPLSNWDVDS
jgi:hypothetical protein